MRILEFFLLVIAIVAAKMVLAMPPHSPTVRPEPTAECLRAQETFRQNYQGLIRDAQNMPGAPVSQYLEANRWIWVPLETEARRLCQ